MSNIAKYRDPRVPGAWFLTDFTMEQVEARLDCLEKELQDIREAHKAIMSERCGDEVHCTCVPTLRSGLEKAKKLLKQSGKFLVYEMSPESRSDLPQRYDHNGRKESVMERKANAWSGYTPPPLHPSKEWWQDTIRGAFNPPTAESIRAARIPTSGKVFKPKEATP